MKTHYLYCLDFPNGKKYIGLTRRPDRRLQDHCQPANKILLVRRAVVKYGAPTFKILCAGSQAYIASLEINAIAAFRTREPEHGYNVSLGGELSPTLVPEVAAKISATMKGKKKPPEHAIRMSALHKGKTISQTHRDAVRLFHTGRKRSPETCAKVSAAKKGVPQPKNRHPLSAETLAKRRANPLYLVHPYSVEVARRMGFGNKGRKRSPEAIAKTRAANTGQKRSPETRAKMRASRLAYLERAKAKAA